MLNITWPTWVIDFWNANFCLHLKFIDLMFFCVDSIKFLLNNKPRNEFINLNTCDIILLVFYLQFIYYIFRKFKIYIIVLLCKLWIIIYCNHMYKYESYLSIINIFLEIGFIYQRNWKLKKAIIVCEFCFLFIVTSNW